MRLLISEFITAGGFLNEAMPATLAREGELIQQQLLDDFAACSSIDTIQCLRDPRMSLIELERCDCIVVDSDFMAAFTQAARKVDAVLPVAPETDDALLAMSEAVESAGTRLLNSKPVAVAATGSKYHTLKTLAAAGIPTVPVSTIDQAAHAAPAYWVIKPDNGVGGEGCRVLERLPDVMPENTILQPLLEGTSASLTMLCADGEAALLAVNEQHVELDANGCVLHGINVNGLHSQMDALRPLAEAIAATIPELWGFVGVDLMLTSGEPLVLEINPRLTTAYAGLHESCGHNPADWLLALADSGELPDTRGLQANAVQIQLT